MLSAAGSACASDRERPQGKERQRLVEEREALIEELEAKNAELERFNYTPPGTVSAKRIGAGATEGSACSRLQPVRPTLPRPASAAGSGPAPATTAQPRSPAQANPLNGSKV